MYLRYRVHLPKELDPFALLCSSTLLVLSAKSDVFYVNVHPKRRQKNITIKR